MLLIVDDPCGVLEQAKAAGATEIYPVVEAHGCLLGRVADPFGHHHWEIGKPLIERPRIRSRPSTGTRVSLQHEAESLRPGADGHPGP